MTGQLARCGQARSRLALGRAATTSLLVALTTGCGGGATTSNRTSDGLTESATTATTPDTGSRSTASTESAIAPSSTTSPPTSPTTTPTTEATTELATASPTTSEPQQGPFLVGAEVAAKSGFSMLAGKRVGLVVNRASMVNGTHLIDALAAVESIDIGAIFAPEHGVRGDLGAGVKVDQDMDPVTGVPVFSLYGENKAPTAEMLDGIDVIVFDLQDVGARYYTYIATLGLTMQAASRAGIPIVVFDRPTPNGDTAPTGFLRDSDHRSFVSQYPVPAQYAMTIGELATAIAGEGWLDDLSGIDLTVVNLENWGHARRWSELDRQWVPPSPGLQSPEAAALYPMLVGLEPTAYSYGSGSPSPFMAVAAPWADADELTELITGLNIAGLAATATDFVPVALPRMNQDPKFEDQHVFGTQLAIVDPDTFSASDGLAKLYPALAGYARAHGHRFIDDSEMFDLLAGSSRLRSLLADGASAETIRSAMIESAAPFAEIRNRYLCYP